MQACYAQLETTWSGGYAKASEQELTVAAEIGRTVAVVVVPKITPASAIAARP